MVTTTRTSPSGQSHRVTARRSGLPGMRRSSLWGRSTGSVFEANPTGRCCNGVCRLRDRNSLGATARRPRARRPGSVVAGDVGVLPGSRGRTGADDASTPGGTSPAEAAFAVAPELIPRDQVSSDSHQVFGCADFYAAKHATRPLRVLLRPNPHVRKSAGQSWTNLGVDWQAALHELQVGPFPSMFLTIGEGAHLLICDPSSGISTADQERLHGSIDYERELAREGRLAADWPAHVRQLISSNRIRQVG